jgi:hypothetical protein
MYEMVWDKIMESYCGKAIVEVLKICRKYYCPDIGLYIGKFLWQIRTQFIQNKIIYTSNDEKNKLIKGKAFIGYVYDKTPDLYQTPFPIKSFVNKAVPEDIVVLYDKWMPDTKKNNYALLECIPTIKSNSCVGFGSIMYGYSYTTKKSHYFSKDAIIHVDESELLNVNVDKCCSPTFNKFIGVLLENVGTSIKEKDIINNATVLLKKYSEEKLYIPLFDDIIDVMINTYIEKFYPNRSSPFYINDEIYDLKNAEHTSHPFLAFIPRKCCCCPYVSA